MPLKKDSGIHGVINLETNHEKLEKFTFKNEHLKEKIEVVATDKEGEYELRQKNGDFDSVITLSTDEALNYIRTYSTREVLKMLVNGHEKTPENFDRKVLNLELESKIDIPELETLKSLGVKPADILEIIDGEHIKKSEYRNLEKLAESVNKPNLFNKSRKYYFFDLIL